MGRGLLLLSFFVLSVSPQVCQTTKSPQIFADAQEEKRKV